MNLLAAINKLRKTWSPKPWPLEKPTVVQFPVNDICNSRCQMCNIWQKKLDHQITPEELATIAENALFSEVRAVGVNGGEPTLRQDLADLVEVLYKKLPNLNGISLITNAYQDQVVTKRIEEVGRVVQKYDGYFEVMVSVDGVGAVHDRVRGKPNNFDRAVKVIDYIQASDLVHNVRLGCTVVRDNVYDLHNLLEFALSKDIYIKYRIGIPHQRLYSQNVVDPFALTFEELYHFVIFLENLIEYYEESEEQMLFYQSLISQLIYNKPRTAGCDWQHRGVTLSSRGELLYCAVQSKTLGSAINQNANELYFANKDHLHNIIRTECDTCLHDYRGLPSRSVLLSLYRRKINNKLRLPPQLKHTSVANQVRYLRQRRAFAARLSALGVTTQTPTGLQPVRKFRRNPSGSPNILICGWYGTETLGDKAILGGVINAIAPNIDTSSLFIASLEKFITEMTIRQMPELENCTVLSIPEALELIDTMELIIVGGGPLMAIAELAELLAIMQRAVQSGIPTLIAGCGVGPLNQSFHNDAISSILSLASQRIYRDQKSLDLAYTLGIDTTADQVAEDPAFSWLHHTGCHIPIKERPERPENHKKLLLGLRDWPFHQYAPEIPTVEAQKIKDRLEEELIAAFELLLQKFPNLTIVPFPMCTNHIGGDDRWFYRRLFQNGSGINSRLDLAYLEAEIEPAAAVGIFQEATAVLTMRYHSLIFALACGTPAVSIDYTLGKGKVYSLANQYKVPQLSLDEIDRESIYEMLTVALGAPPDRPIFEADKLQFKNAVRSCMASFSQ